MIMSSLIQPLLLTKSTSWTSSKVCLQRTLGLKKGQLPQADFFLKKENHIYCGSYGLKLESIEAHCVLNDILKN